MNNLIELFKEQHDLCANDMAGGDYNFQYIEWLEKRFDEINPKTGLEEKLKEILNNNEYRILRYENDISELTADKGLYILNNFHEEHRIASVKYDAMFMVVDHFRSLHTEIKDALSAWLS